MSDNISRQEALKDAESWVAVDSREQHMKKQVIEWIRNFPPAPEAQRRGYWRQYSHKLARVCSCCGHDEPYKFADDDADIYNFCPHCGADMRGEQYG